MDRKTQLHIFWYAFGALMLLLLLLVQDWWQTARETELIPCSVPRQGRGGDRHRHHGEQPSALATRRLHEPQGSKTARRDRLADPAVARELQGHGVDFQGVVENTAARHPPGWC
ncbi:MAG: hypothetical protein U1E17_01525 [Geminicoccaceae bacterium]